jgi:phosphoadenosine phosphosulfate reductase
MKEVVSFSGGKDSLVVMDMMAKKGINEAVYVYSDLEFDQTLKYVESLQDIYDIDIIKSKISFFDIIKKRKLCLPSRQIKWCCKVFKFVPLAIYAKKHKIDVYYTGIRGGESQRRSQYSHEGSGDDVFFPWKEKFPIFNWGEKDVWRYIRRNNLPINPLYQLVNRVGCWLCPNNGKRDWGAARDMMPQKYNEFKKILKDYANDEIDPEWRRYFIKGGWQGWKYKTDVEIVGTLNDGDDMVEVEKKLNCISCAACKVLTKVNMKCIARAYNPHRKVMV